MNVIRAALPFLLTLPAGAQVDLALPNPQVRAYFGADGNQALYGNDRGDNTLAGAIGDLNADGHQDLVVVMGGDDGPLEGRPDVGALGVYFGPIVPGGDADLRATPPHLLIYRDDAMEGMGLFAAVVGDLNGDGFDDLIFGSQFAGTPGRVQAGEVLAMFGPLGPGVLDLSITAPDWKLVGRDGLNQVGDNKGDRTYPVELGDFDGDGHTDLLISGWLSDGPANSRLIAGELLVLFGGPGTILAGPASLDLATLNDYWIVYGAEARHSIDAVSFVDLDGDGTTDLTYSAESSGPAGPRPFAGSVGIFLGGSHVRPQPGQIEVRDLAIDDPEIIFHGAEDFDFLRTAVVADFNGDGQNDLALGAILASGPNNDRFGAGETYLLFGGSALMLGVYPMVVDLATSGAFDTVIYGADIEDLSSLGLGSADLNGDGRADLVISAPQADGPGNTRVDAGEVYVLLGRDVFDVEIDLRDPVDLHFVGAGSLTPNIDDDSGDNLLFKTAGDLTGNGLDELILESPSGDGPQNARQRAGEIYVFFPGIFRRGDLNGDSEMDSRDWIRLIRRVWFHRHIPCEDAADMDDSGSLNSTDVSLFLQAWLFGGAAIPAPYDSCGVDLTPDNLICEHDFSGGCL